MMSLENHSECVRAKSETLKPDFCLFFSMFLFVCLFWHWHVKGFSSKRITLKIDVLQDRKIYCFRGASVHLSLSPGKCTGWGSAERVNTEVRGPTLSTQKGGQARIGRYSEGEAAWVVDWRTH